MYNFLIFSELIRLPYLLSLLSNILLFYTFPLSLSPVTLSGLTIYLFFFHYWNLFHHLFHSIFQHLKPFFISSSLSFSYFTLLLALRKHHIFFSFFLLYAILPFKFQTFLIFLLFIPVLCQFTPTAYIPIAITSNSTAFFSRYTLFLFLTSDAFLCPATLGISPSTYAHRDAHRDALTIHVTAPLGAVTRIARASLCA